MEYPKKMCRFWLSGKASPCEIGLSWFQDWDSPAQLMRDPLSHAGLWTRKCLIIFHTWKTTICTISFLVCEIRKKGRTKINQNKTGVQKCFLPAKFYRSSTANNNYEFNNVLSVCSSCTTLRVEAALLWQVSQSLRCPSGNHQLDWNFTIFLTSITKSSTCCYFKLIWHFSSQKKCLY